MIVFVIHKLNSSPDLSPSQLHTLLRKNTCGCDRDGCALSQGKKIAPFLETLMIFNFIICILTFLCRSLAQRL